MKHLRIKEDSLSRDAKDKTLAKVNIVIKPNYKIKNKGKNNFLGHEKNNEKFKKFQKEKGVKPTTPCYVCDKIRYFSRDCWQRVNKKK